MFSLTAGSFKKVWTSNSIMDYQYIRILITFEAGYLIQTSIIMFPNLLKETSLPIKTHDSQI